MDRITLLVTFAIVTVAEPTCAQSYFWYPQPAAAPPPVHVVGASAFDVARGRMVVAGVHQGFSRLHTWEFDGTSWSQRDTNGPSASGEGLALVYDSVRSQVLAVLTSRNSSIETYRWDGTTWTALATPAVPPWRRGLMATHDASRGVTVLFGGSDGNSHRSDTWELDSMTWRQRSSGGPPARIGAGITFDVRRQRTVLFGGWDSSQSGFFGDTWEWDGSVWREHFGVLSPTRRYGQLLTYDTARERTLLYGGSDPYAGRSFYELWEWDGIRWTLLTTRGTQPLWFRTFAYDSARKRGLLVGTEQVSNQPVFRSSQLLDVQNPQATYQAFGSGCQGSAGVPALAAQTGSLPWIDSTLTVVGTNFPSSPLRIPVGLLGLSRTSWGGANLPLDLSPFGAPGCSLLISPDLNVPLTAQNGQVTWPIGLPADPGLIGGRFYQQFLVIDQSANALGLAFSNAGEARVGVR